LYNFSAHEKPTTGNNGAGIKVNFAPLLEITVHFAFGAAQFIDFTLVHAKKYPFALCVHLERRNSKHRSG